MKLKENKGMSLIVFTIILAVLLVVAGVAIVYLLNNPKVVEKTPTIVQSNVQNNQNVINNNTNVLEKEEITDNNIFDNEYKTLNELALLKISSGELTKKEEIYEYDFNNDVIKEKITIKETEDTNIYDIYFQEQQLMDRIYNYNIYVVDLDKSDKYLDLIISHISDGGASTTYNIYKNNGTSLEKLKYTTEKAITGDFEGNNFCFDKNNNFILLGDPEASLDSIVTNTYYSIKNNVIYSTKIENIETDKIYKVKKEYVDFTTDYNKTTIEYTAENRYLKVGTELQIIEWLKGPGGQEIIKVKLASGEIGYIYEAYA